MLGHTARSPIVNHTAIRLLPFSRGESVQNVITLASRKGGVGKSTLTAHLAAFAHLIGYRTMVVDADPQGSLTLWHSIRARPGGNAAGFMAVEFGSSAKWIELLKQIAPQGTRVGVIRDPGLGEDRPIESCFGKPPEALSTRCGGEGATVFYGMAKPVRAPQIGPARQPQ
jgi:hypothetical protein